MEDFALESVFTVSYFQSVAVFKLETLIGGLIPLIEENPHNANTLAWDPNQGVTAVRPHVPAVALSN